MKLNNYPLSRKENIVMQDAGDEILLYDLNDNKAFCLNETSALVWELCDGNSSVADINQKLGKKLNQSTDENLVWLALDQLKKEKLLSNSEEVNIDFNGLSRREAVKKVGIASLVALPMIIAIASPAAAASASCIQPAMQCATGDTAAFPGNCSVAGLTSESVALSPDTGGCTGGCTCVAPSGSPCVDMQAILGSCR